MKDFDNMYEWLRGERHNKSIGKIRADSQMLSIWSLPISGFRLDFLIRQQILLRLSLAGWFGGSIKISVL